MIGYAAHTGGRKVTLALRAAGWGFVMTPQSHGKCPTGMRYFLDNGAWSAYQNGTPWDPMAFERAVEALGRGADFIVLPDIVAGGQASLRRSRDWIPILRGACARLLLPVQDGMMPQDVLPYLARDIGLFVGGTTDWKLATLMAWGRLAHAEGAPYLHVARVNTARRLSACAGAGADSFDGSSVTRFSKTLPEFDAARRRGVLFNSRSAA